MVVNNNKYCAYREYTVDMPTHYILCHHGVLGGSMDFRRFEKHFKSIEKTHLVILKSNERVTRTLDGVSDAGERCAKEIVNFVSSLNHDEHQYLSVIGHSMGGVTLRFALRRIEEEQPDFWERMKIKRRLAIFIACPHVGLSSSSSWFIRTTSQYIWRHLSRTAADLTLNTDVLASLTDDVAMMSLDAFDRICLMGNAHGDRLVSATSALILMHVDTSIPDSIVTKGHSSAEIMQYVVPLKQVENDEMRPDQQVLIERINGKLGDKIVRYLVFFPTSYPSFMQGIDNSAHTKIIAHGFKDIFGAGMPVVEFVSNLILEFS